MRIIFLIKKMIIFWRTFFCTESKNMNKIFNPDQKKLNIFDSDQKNIYTCWCGSKKLQEFYDPDRKNSSKFLIRIKRNTAILWSRSKKNQQIFDQDNKKNLFFWSRSKKTYMFFDRDLEILWCRSLDHDPMD